MLIYFSATGNTKHLVERIENQGETIVSVEDAMRTGTFEYEIEDDRLGILSPVYFFGFPSIVNEFLNKVNLKFDRKPYVFYVGTFGTTTGASDIFLEKILEKKGLALDAQFDIRFPDTWTVLFDLSDEEKVSRQKARADKEIDELVKQLNECIRGKHMDMTTPMFIGKIAQKIYNNSSRKTSKLSVSDACISCGLCEKKCPVQAIKMQDKKPVWVKDKCTMCLGCLHRCPKHAIAYGNGRATNNHGQYIYR